ncbi:MAG: hypothetical protein SCARUB_04815, partial [Candidatus Scalindua rubra]
TQKERENRNFTGVELGITVGQVNRAVVCTSVIVNQFFIFETHT